MLIGYCPVCHKAGLRYKDGLAPRKRYCPRCQKGVIAYFLSSAKRTRKGGIMLR